MTTIQTPAFQNNSLNTPNFCRTNKNVIHTKCASSSTEIVWLCEDLNFLFVKTLKDRAEKRGEIQVELHKDMAVNTRKSLISFPQREAILDPLLSSSLRLMGYLCSHMSTQPSINSLYILQYVLKNQFSLK